MLLYHYTNVTMTAVSRASDLTEECSYVHR